MIKKIIAGISILVSTVTLAVVNPTGGTTTTYETCLDQSSWNVCPPPIAPIATDGAPVLEYMNIDSAPRSGWSVAEPTKGAVVSIWGWNFGGPRAGGDDYVTVGGVNLTANSDYFYNWGQVGTPVKMLQRVTFQLNDSIPLGNQNVTITVDGVTSNTKTIKITENDIFFLDAQATGTDSGTFENPWDGFADFRTNMGPGDIGYVKGTWSEPQTGGSGQIVFFNGSTTSGTSADPITIAGWPDETVLFDTNQTTTTGCFVTNNDYLTITDLDMDCDQAGINSFGDGAKVIGNNIKGMTQTDSGTGSIVFHDDFGEAYANHLYGATSGNDLDHAIYVQGCMAEVGGGAKVAHNHIEDFNVNDGAQIVVNHQDDRCAVGEYLVSHYIYSNVIDMRIHGGRGLGVFHQGWDVADTTDPEPTYIYNNTTLGGGSSGQPTNYQNSSDVHWYNNAFLDANYRGLSVNHVSRTKRVTINNNIFDMADSGDNVYFGTIPTIDIDTNIYNGGTGAPTEETNAINVDPGCLYDDNFAVISCNTSTSDVGVTIPLASPDYKLKTRSAPYDIGPLEDAAYGDPQAAILFFSDMESGPDNGWSAAEPNKGAAVSVWGTGFGAGRGSSYITVNGVDLTEASDYPATWGDAGTHPYLQKITFHLKSSMTDGLGSITLTNSQGTSNALPFTIRSGRIQFIDADAVSDGTGTLISPYNDPTTYFTQEQIGDVVYLRGTFDQNYAVDTSGKYVMRFNNEIDGTAAQPISLIGYPGEITTIDALTNNDGNFARGISLQENYYVLANLRFTTFHESVTAGRPSDSIGNYIRIVGNDIEGQKDYTSGNGVLEIEGSGVKSLGNVIHGITTGNKLDHAIYLRGCASIDDTETAWNYIYDNDVGNVTSSSDDGGALIIVNHQDTRCAASQQLQSHYIHSNFLDCSEHPTRAIGISDQSYDAGDTGGNPLPTYVYNNTGNQCVGANFSGAFYTNAWDTEFYNNACIDCKYDIFNVADSNVNRVISKNNIWVAADTGATYEDIDGTPTTLTIDNNLYFGDGTYTGVGTNPVNGDPLLTYVSTPFDLYLGTGSPAIGAGVVVPLVTGDWLLNPSTNPPNIGPTQEVK